MELTFGNPAGFWALLGIPAVLIIHFLQRKSEVVTITTLFLLDQMRRESESGSRFERLRSSIPLWLQLLMVLLLAWILSEPRWLRRDSVQRVAIVLDASASMTVFKDAALARLRDVLARLAPAAGTSEYLVMESTGSDRRLYTGTDRADLVDAAGTWTPRLGQHDPSPAFRLARSLVGPEGIVVHVTDHVPAEPPPFNTRVLAVGEPTVNVGFAGLTIEERDDGGPGWSATIRNYGEAPVTREWWLESGTYRTTPSVVSIGPEETAVVRGPFVEGADRAVLRLASDAFAVDDSLPILRPRPKPLTLSLRAPDEIRDEIAELFAPLEALMPWQDGGEGSAPPDLVVTITGPGAPPLPASGTAVAFVVDPRNDLPYSAERIVAANHPLVEELNWQSLLARQVAPIAPLEADEPLVWQGGFPLVFLRSSAELDLLGLNLDLRKSNASRLPALIVLLHRFVEQTRAAKIADEALNVETGQDLAFAFDVSPSAGALELRIADGSTTVFPLMQAGLIDAPPLPGFFEIRQGQLRLLEGAAHFADTREADLRGAASIDELAGISAEMIERHSERDSLWRAWLLVIVAALLASWWFAQRSAEGSETVPKRPADRRARTPRSLAS